MAGGSCAPAFYACGRCCTQWLLKACDSCSTCASMCINHAAPLQQTCASDMALPDGSRLHCSHIAITQLSLRRPAHTLPLHSQQACTTFIACSFCSTRVQQLGEQCPYVHHSTTTDSACAPPPSTPIKGKHFACRPTRADPGGGRCLYVCHSTMGTRVWCACSLPTRSAICFDKSSSIMPSMDLVLMGLASRPCPDCAPCCIRCSRCCCRC